ncbi:gephyrin-like molybdotransferase Glp [Jatrophihabitans sp.]|uniref:molybdopterin molybdotransferase MoeA n=1 Tax=Jatrophihabitans sp. TaxID=1932789 RepID=UPI0030C65C0E
MAEHQRIVAELIPAARTANLPLRAAAGRVLAGDQVAAVALPSFDNSAMDGYAVRAAEIATATASAPVRLPVAEDIPAGRVDRPVLAKGTVHRIMTGAPLPTGADSVVQVEHTDGGVETVAISEPARAGAHIRRSGEDVRSGDRVLTDGTPLGPAQVGLLAALGLAAVPVYAPLRVLVLSTGSELVTAGERLQHGQIYDSNGPMLAVAVQDCGAEATLLHFVADDIAALHAALDEQLGAVDLIVTTGGVSAGAYEVVKDALAEEDVVFAKVAMQPGMPQGAGRYRGVPIVTFPGNPISSLVSFEVFLRPALRAAMGYPSARRPVLAARLREPLDSPRGRRQFRRGTFDATTGEAALMGAPASHFLYALAHSNCLLDIGEEVEHLEAGELVDVWDLRGC